MTTGRGSALLRSISVLFVLLLALFAGATETAATETAATGAPATGAPARGAVPASSGPVAASCAQTERVARTAADEAPTTVGPDAEPPAATLPAADRAPALTSQDTAGAAVSRAPPHAA